MRTWPAKLLNIPLWAWLVIFAFLQICVALFTYSMSLSFDESIWYYVGRNWFRHGMVPYSGGVDNKSPLIFAIFGFSDFLFGINEWFPRIVGTVGQSFGLYFVYRLAKILSNDRAALFALTIYGLSLLWPSAGGKYVSYTETYSVAAVIAAYYFYYENSGTKKSVLSGFLGGLAIGFRVSAVLTVLGLFISVIIYRPKSFVSVGAGLLISMILLLSAAWLSKINIGDYFEHGFRDNFGTGSATDHDWQWKLRNFSSHFFLSGFVVFLPAIIAWFFLPVRNYPVFIWFCTAFLAIHLIGIFSTQHFKELLPSLALIAALVIEYFTREWNIFSGVTLILIWIVFFPKTLEPIIGLRNYLFQKSPEKDFFCNNKKLIPDEAAKKRLGLWIRSATNPADKVLIAGYGAEVQAYSERISPTVYFNTTETESAIRRLKWDLTRAPKPSMVIIPAYDDYDRQVVPELRLVMNDFVSRDYDLDSCAYGYYIYKMKSPSK
jgi:hypothetical protein